jgi:hypothetical protein
VIDAPPPDYSQYEEQVVEELTACGLKRAGLSVRFDDVLQHFVVTISAKAQANSEQFKCIESTSVRHEVKFEDEALEKAYWAPISARLRKESLASARAHLQKRGLLEGLPTIESAGGLAAFLPALEEHCGFAAGSALRIIGTDEVQLFANFPHDEASLQKSSCVLSGLMLAGISKFGFLGNELIETSDD